MAVDTRNWVATVAKVLTCGGGKERRANDSGMFVREARQPSEARELCA
jgi:hypothetical protein